MRSNFVGDFMDRSYDVIRFQNTSNLARPSAANFDNIIKVAATMAIEITFKDSKKVKRIRNYILKCNLNLYFLI